MKKLAIVGVFLALSGCAEVENYNDVVKTPAPAGLEGLVQRVITLSKQTYKPLIIVADGGRMYDPLRDTLRDNGIPVFNLCDRAVAALSLYIESRLAAQSIRELGVSTCASRNMQ